MGPVPLAGGVLRGKRKCSHRMKPLKQQGEELGQRASFRGSEGNPAIRLRQAAQRKACRVAGSLLYLHKAVSKFE